MKKKIILLSILTALCMVLFGILSVSAQSGGTCGDNLTWTLDDNGSLVISGRGYMYDYSDSLELGAPWYGNKENITSVTIDDGVRSIGKCAFFYCSSLTDINIPNSVTSIGDYAFPGCKSLTDINLPDGVTKIGRDAFYGCSSLKSITIPDSVRSIGNSAFYACYSLESIAIPNGVTNVGEETFFACDSLTSVNLPDSVTSIGDSAFSNCTALTSVTIGNSVTSIGNSAFSYCTSLTQINWNAKNVADFSSDNDVFDYAGQRGDGISVMFGDNVRRIPAYAFCPHLDSDAKYAPKITTVIIGNGVTNIGNHAFSDCTYLTDITIGSSVLSVGNMSFYECTGLKHVNITDIKAWCNIKFSDYYSNPLYFARNLYLNGELVTNLVIPDDVSSIGEYAFYACTGLESVTIGDSVTNIGEYAFYFCAALTQINWNAKKVADFDYNNYVFANAGERGDGVSVIFGNSVEKIPNFAFCPCLDSTIYTPEITSVIIGDNVASIGIYAFDNCKYLTSVTMGSGITSIDDYAFRNCTALTSVTIGDNVTNIGFSAFSDCTDLTSVTIGDSVTSIGNSAFYNCTALTQINWNAKNVADFYSNNYVFANAGQRGDGVIVIFGNSVEKIPNFAFCPCSDSTIYTPEITSVIIGDNVASIGISAFRNCTYLTSVTIGDSVTSIGNSAFNNCTSLTQINWNAKNVADFNSNNAFAKAGKRGVGVSVIFGDKVERIPANAFYIYSFGGDTSDAPKITNVIMGDSVTSIGDYTFFGCDTLSNVYYKGSLNEWNDISIGSGNVPFTNASIHYIKHIRTTLSEDGKTFTVTPVNVENGKTVILALYNGEEFVEMKSAVFDGEVIPFTTTKSYTDAKVMVWDSMINLKPVCDVETVK